MTDDSAARPGAGVGISPEAKAGARALARRWIERNLVVSDEDRMQRYVDAAWRDHLHEAEAVLEAAASRPAPEPGDGGDAMPDRDGLDGTARLCRALYGRKERAGDYLGGSDARMLHDAADRLAASGSGDGGGDARLRAEVERLTRERDEAREDRRTLTRALTGLTCNGSEFFVRRGDEYVADIPACLAWINRAKQDAVRGRIDAIHRQKEAEDRAATAERALGDARDAGIREGVEMARTASRSAAHRRIATADGAVVLPGDVRRVLAALDAVADGLAGPARGRGADGLSSTPEASVVNGLGPKSAEEISTPTHAENASVADPAEPGRAGARRAGTICGLLLVVDPTIPDGEIHAKVDGRKVAELIALNDREHQP